MALFDWLEFDSPEEREKKRKKQLYEVGEATGRFFWDDAPGKFGFEEREGQQDMAFEILEAIKKRATYSSGSRRWNWKILCLFSSAYAV